MGKCFPAGNFPQGQLSQADREFPLLPSPSCPHPPPLSLAPPPPPPCLLRWPISHREIPLCAYQSSQHTPCLPGSFLLGVNPHLGKPFGPALCFCLWVLMGPSSASVLGAMGALGPFGVKDVCALGGKGESSCPSQSPLSLLLTPLPLPAEAPVSGPLDTGMGPCLELVAPLHPRRRGHGPGALAGPPEPGPRAGREVTRGDKASACLGTGAGCCLPLLCSSHGARQGRALSAGSGIPDRPDNSRSSRLLLEELGPCRDRFFHCTRKRNVSFQRINRWEGVSWC